MWTKSFSFHTNFILKGYRAESLKMYFLDNLAVWVPDIIRNYVLIQLIHN